MKCASVVVQGQHSQHADDDGATNGAQCAEIADSFTQRESAHVQREKKRNDEQRGDAGKRLTVGEFLDCWSRYVDGSAATGENHGGQIDPVREPVTPAGKEAVLFAKATLGPKINPSLARPLLG